ncbi:diiron oxygenase [Polynucleobacter sp. JS-Safj-400b-B2]|uniref:diiron oxygenase n=1 Tax=Polynucleobacter sp. JS-Safj-400b-B2 TaxID=2576921 RepID=UPI001C0CB50C|nr:diiron oxygenase [Polynucleobacter sp. JS-Safj-400b-B2]MBU3627230.1 diiron oxygenase [Polynucleobacter sp. JS-Safj-400b-B2]
MLLEMETYVTHANDWEDRATIRTRPRRKLEDDSLAYYPSDRQPLVLHPIIAGLGKEVVNYILQQSLYKYINDVIIFETEIVNKTASEIGKNKFPYEFSFACRYDAMSVVIDEDYHAYVALDYMNQIIEATGVSPIPLPNKIELSSAIPEAVKDLAEEHHHGMELIAVAISENTVTADVAAFSRDPGVKRSIKGLMGDHLSDEGRHSIFWTNLVKIFWKNIDEKARIAIGGAIPRFLDRYLTNEIQREFDTKLIDSLNLHSSIADEIKRDMSIQYPITSTHPMIENIKRFLERSGILEHQETKIKLEKFI